MSTTLILSGPGFFLEIPKQYIMLNCIIAYDDQSRDDGLDMAEPVPGRLAKAGSSRFRRLGRYKKSRNKKKVREPKGKARIEITIRYREGNHDIFSDTSYSSYDNIVEVRKLYDCLVKQIAEQHNVMHLVKLYHQNPQELALGMIGDAFQRTIAEQVYKLSE
jgi:hypothetical protein